MLIQELENQLQLKQTEIENLERQFHLNRDIFRNIDWEDYIVEVESVSGPILRFMFITKDDEQYRFVTYSNHEDFQREFGVSQRRFTFNSKENVESLMPKYKALLRSIEKAIDLCTVNRAKLFEFIKKTEKEYRDNVTSIDHNISLLIAEKENIVKQIKKLKRQELLEKAKSEVLVEGKEFYFYRVDNSYPYKSFIVKQFKSGGWYGELPSGKYKTETFRFTDEKIIAVYKLSHKILLGSDLTENKNRYVFYVNNLLSAEEFMGPLSKIKRIKITNEQYNEFRVNPYIF